MQGLGPQPAFETALAALPACLLDAPIGGNGLRHQILEVHRCIEAGLHESPVMPVEESISILHTLDGVREALGDG